MKRLLIGGNWKMNLTLDGARVLARALADGYEPVGGVEVILFPPFPFILPVAEIVRGTGLGVGGQNCHQEESGAYTGAVAPRMLLDVGAQSVLVGHSERRQLFGEGDDLLRAKLRTALKAGLSPMFCVGETLAEREDGRMEAVLARQVESAFDGLDETSLSRISVAYEPVWAIGTGRTATPDQAESAHRFIRSVLARLFGPVQESVPILYGGSVKAENAGDLLSRDGIDGALVGGASLRSDPFLGIIGAAGRVQAQV